MLLETIPPDQVAGEFEEMLPDSENEAYVESSLSSSGQAQVKTSGQTGVEGDDACDSVSVPVLDRVSVDLNKGSQVFVRVCSSSSTPTSEPECERV